MSNNAHKINCVPSLSSSNSFIQQVFFFPESFYMCKTHAEDTLASQAQYLHSMLFPGAGEVDDCNTVGLSPAHMVITI